MNRREDAYGRLLWDYLERRAATEIVERDDGFIATSCGPLAYFAEFPNWPKHQRRGIRFARGRVLDVGAGAGRVALYLQRRGHQVTTIDNSPLAVELCRKRGLRNATLLPVERIGNFTAGAFDTIVMYGNNFGLFGAKRKAHRLLREFYRITSPDAAILAESNDPYRTRNPAHLRYHRRNRRRGRMAGQVRIRIRHLDACGPWFDYLLVSPEEMAALLQGTGWRIGRIFRGGAPYVAVIEKAVKERDRRTPGR
jgi:SAM-dependent methyltransferase